MNERTRAYEVFGLGWVYELAQQIVRSDRSRSQFFNRFVRAENGMRILDFGCGTGDALQHLPDVEYVGIDSNPRYLNRARQRLKARGEIRHGDVSALSSFRKHEFNIILALGVLHHINDTDTSLAIREFARILRPDGRLITHDPIVIDGQTRIARWFVEHDRGPHIRRVETVEHMLGSAFTAVHSEIIERPLRIPFTEIAVVCSNPLE